MHGAYPNLRLPGGHLHGYRSGMPNVLVLLGHPDPQSFNGALADAYAAAAERAGARVELLRLVDLDFDPILRMGFRGEQPLEPDLVRARAAIEAADHVVWVFPTWWASAPALVRGFVDRVFLPGWAFRNHEGSSLPEKLLRGRSARIVTTMDAPRFWYVLAYRSALHHAFVTATLDYCGVGPVAKSTVYSVRNLDARARERAIARVAEEARADVARLAKGERARRGEVVARLGGG